uniref:RP1 axonemal microtubule associated n=1 Tax=Callorhinchus milii TaxID=7868 RepID=A0A4W3K3J8_CALMI
MSWSQLPSAQQPAKETGDAYSIRPSYFGENGGVRRVDFYKSGDPQFGNLRVAINSRTFKTFDSLLDNLSKKIPLPFGVRTITTPLGVHHITSLEDFQDGNAYICSDQKKVKPINFELASRKPVPWLFSRPATAQHRVTLLARQYGHFIQDPTMAIRPGRKLIVFKNGISGGNRTLILNRKTVMNFDALLNHITELMRFPVIKLYTTDGRKVRNQAYGSVVAAGREVFKHRRYDSPKYEYQQQSLAGKLPAISNRVHPLPINKKDIGRNTWVISVLTSDLPSAGTTAQVHITLYGKEGNSGPIVLHREDENAFQNGQKNIFTVISQNIGNLYKIRIGHNNSGEFPGWHCEKIDLENLYSGKKYHFDVNSWMDQKEEDGEICREFSVIENGEPILPVINYDVLVSTGDTWNGGTNANVFIVIYGKRGDTGSRQLIKSNHAKMFQKGQTDTFSLEAVDLGNLKKLVIGHDGLGAGQKLYMLLTFFIKSVYFAYFRFYRWLDQGEDDGKIARELYAVEIFSQLASKWKFKAGNILQFYCKGTGKFIRLMPDGTVDATASKNDPNGMENSKELLIYNNKIILIFNVIHRNLALAVDRNRAVALDKGRSLSQLKVSLKSNRCVILDSAQVLGHIIAFNAEGRPADASAVGSSPITTEFAVHIKGMFRDGAVVLLNTNFLQCLHISPDGSCRATGKQSLMSYLRVHKVGPKTYMFESVQNPNKFIQIRSGRCDGLGIGDHYCHFRLENNLDKGAITLESVKYPGIYLGLHPSGQTMPTVNTGVDNLMLYPQVINCSYVAEVRESRASEITHSKIVSNNNNNTCLWYSALSCLQDWKVNIMTGAKAAKGKVSLAVYGDQGMEGPILLQKSNTTTPFLPNQNDEFKLTMQHIKSGLILKFHVDNDEDNAENVFEFSALGKSTGQPLFSVQKYKVSIYTKQVKHKEFNTPVYLRIYGERGDTGDHNLCASFNVTLFQVAIFYLEAVSLGPLHKVLLTCNTNNVSQRWYCEKVVIKELSENGSGYVFICER